MLPVRVRSRTAELSKKRRHTLYSAALQSVEPLEERIFWSVTQDANGFTVVSNPNANIIYVDNTPGVGSDTNPGTMNAPVATLSRAQALSTSGGNEILLKSGDTFTESASSNINSWKLSGASAQNPFLLSYYGTGARPMIYAGVEGVAFEVTPGTAVSNLDIIGLQFDANLRDPTLQTVNTSMSGEDKGIELQGTGSGFLIEDCQLTYFGNAGGDNLDIEGNNGSLSNITIRRCVVNNAYGFNGGKCEGLYAYNVSGISVVQSTFDHNGWNSAYLYLGAEDIGYNHDMYFGPTCTGVDVEQNVIADASYAGVMARAGGTINYNLFLNDAVACSFGSADGVMSTVGGVSGSLIGNVVMGDRASQTIYYHTSAGAYMIGAGVAFGQGFVIANTAPSANVMCEYNVFTGDTQNAKPAITLTMATTTTNPAQAVGINNLTVAHNVIDGWRWGIQTDGRFVPGATGLYALNGLTISHNDFVNSNVDLVRHDGAFAASAESWSGDRYIDTLGLSQSNWVTLQSKSIAFATWAATYDIGATALFTLPYSAPGRSVATYDTTQGGPGTNADYVAQSIQLSIYDYRPQYMAQAAITYIDAGFNITSTGGTIGGGGGTGSSNPGVVIGSAVASDVNSSSLGLTVYTFTVNFLDQFTLNTAKLGSNNIMVTGPNGFYELATFVSAGTPYVDANYYQHTVATYQIAPPGGAWTAADNGTYSIVLLPNQALDSSGAIAQTGVIGTFIADLTNPVAMAVAPNIVSNGATSSSLTVTYSDAYGIDTSTLNSFEVQVTGPNNYSQYATLSSQAASNNNQSVVATYTLVAPVGGWTAAANGTYTVSMLAGGVADLESNTVAPGVLTTFTVAGSNASTGTASISGTIFNDANGNGVMDSRELPMVGVTVFIDVNGTGVYNASNDVSTTTDGNGNYSFSSLMAGRYTIVEMTPSGYMPSVGSTGSSVVTLTAGQALTGVNFADQVGTTAINSGSGSSNSGSTNSSSGIHVILPTKGVPVTIGKVGTPGTITEVGT
jgi:hypothetical protein